MKLFKILESRLLDQPTKTPDQIAQEQNVPVARVMKALKAGIAVEQEHTSDIGVAREIALDHLAERWDYYDVLARADRNTVTEAPVPGTQFVTLTAAQIREGLTWLDELAEQINDESMQFENRPDIYRKLERDHRAVTAVQTVMQNNLRAIKYPEMMTNSIFLYDVDDSDLSYMEFVGAIHVVLEDRVAEVKWIGSYDADGGGLLKAAMKIAKQRGATSMKLDAKWESEGFYTKMGFQQTGPTVSQPLSGSQLTPFSKELDESARLLELFDPLKLPANVSIEYDEFWGSWKVQIQDQVYSVSVNKKIMTLPPFRDKHLGIYTVEFGISTPGMTRYGITKTGKSFEIFAAVAAILYKFQKSHSDTVKGYYFTAQEPSRQKLYAVLSDKMAQVLGWKNDRDLVKQYFYASQPSRGFFVADRDLCDSMHAKLQQESPPAAIEMNWPHHRELDEVAMSPNALKTWVRQNANVINNVTMGFEAEMCVPNLEGSDEDDGLEPDYSMDEYISDYNWQQDVKNFFSGDGMNSLRDIQRAIEACDEDIGDWISDGLMKSITKADVLERIRSNNPDLSTQEIMDEYENQEAEHDTALEELSQEYQESFTFDDWARDNDCRQMSHFADRYNLAWPHWQSTRSQRGDYSYSELADSWTSSSGYNSTASTGYHSAKRQPDLWIFEPDSSIRPDDSEEGGVELVSPPMPFQDGIDALTKFFAWAQNAGAYANTSCGFHIGVSLPQAMQKAIDPVKLLLFLGDEYVLAQFERSANTYARSSMKALRNKLRDMPGLKNSNPQDGMAVVKRILANPARAELGHLLKGSGRYVSVNIKDNYIEFRSAGGDYFEKQQEIFNTVMRYVRAMTIAADPQAEKQEYLKKLYKLLAGSIQQSDNPVGAFMRYAAGQITRDELIAIMQQKRDSKLKQSNVDDTKEWYHWIVLRAVDNHKVHEFLAPDDQAQEKLQQWAASHNENPAQYVLRPEVFENSGPMQHTTAISETWSRKYKKSIDCSNPKGFSQRAHCAGRKKRQRHGGTSSRSVSENQEDLEIRNYRKLDAILTQLCDLVDSRRAHDSEKYGLVGAALLDPRNQMATGVSTHHKGRWYHAEQRAITAYEKKYGSIPQGCIIVVTCSPCSERMDSREGISCTDLINNSPVKKVYCGFDDQTQPEDQRVFNIIETADPEIRQRCQALAEQFMDGEAQQIEENFPKGPVSIDQEAGDSGLEGYVIDSQQEQLENYLDAQGAGQDVVHMIRDKYRRIAILKNIWVNEEERGQGVGSGLLEAAIDEAASRGAQAAILVAQADDDQDQDRLEAWYASYGFETIASVNAGYPVMALVLGRINETLKKVKGRWALVSRKDPSKVLQYYHGGGHPSKEWVSKVERRVHSFSESDVPNWKYINFLDGLLAIPKHIRDRQKQPDRKADVDKKFYDLSEAKIKLYTDPDYYGADVDDSVGNGLPVVDIPLSGLVGFEPDSKMKNAKSAANMNNMVELIKSGKGTTLPPIFVRKYKSGYQVLDGHHRFHAFQKAGAKTIPAKIIPDSEIQVFDKAPEIEEISEMLKKVKGTWALVSRQDPSKVLQYYRGSGHPSQAWISKVERRVHSFSENFEDGKGPGRPGDSQRHGIPKNATMAQLTKAARAKGRKGQLARWQINMRQGQKKESLQELFDPNNLPGDIKINLDKDYPDKKTWTITRADQKWVLGIYQGHTQNIWDVVFHVGGNRPFDITGTGSAPQIFAAVGSLLYREAQQNRHVQGYLFTAKEPSRVKLYTVLSKKLAQGLSWVYDPDLGAQLFPWSNETVFAILSKEKYADVKEKLSEASQPSAQTGAALTVWDIDDTLMHTAARVFVVEPSGRRRKLSPSEFNSYELRPGEKYDFAEFTDSQLFYDTSKPIDRIWRTAQNTLANIGKRPGSRMIIVTARAEFDNTSLFLKTFEKHGMDMSKVKVYTVAGASNKKPLIRRLLDNGTFTEARLFDDHPNNLQDFLSLHEEFPQIKLKAFPVGHNGAVGKPITLGGK